MAKEIVETEYRLIDRVTEGFRSISGALSGLSTTFTELNQASELAGKGIDLFVGAAQKIGDAVTGAADVEDALARVQIRTAATAEEMVLLNQSIRDAVDGTRFSSEEAAAALGALAEDGLNATESVDQLGRVLAFAQANSLGAAEGAAQLGAVLDSYQAAPDQIGEIADSLTAVAAAAGASTTAIADGVNRIGVSASAAGVSINEAAGLIGVLAANGLEGAAATGRLNTVLRDFSDESSKFSASIRDAGLSGKSFGEVIGKLKIDSKLAAEVLATLGDKPREAMRLLLVEGGADLKSFSQVVEDSAGAAQAAADVLNRTFNGALEQLSNRLAQVRNDFLTPILQPLARELEGLSSRLRLFAASPEFAKLTEKFSAFATGAAKDIGDFITTFNFEDAASRLSTFVSACGVLFNAIVVAAELAAGSIRLLIDAYDALSLRKLREESARDFQGLATSIDGATAAAYAASAGIGNLDYSLDTVGATAKKAGDAAKEATVDYKNLAIAMLPEPARNLALALTEADDKQKATQESIKKLSDEYRTAVYELEDLSRAYKTTSASGADGAKLAAAEFQKASDKVEELRKKLNEAKASAIDLTDEFKTLGIKSQEDIVKSAELARKALESIAEASRSGAASQADVNRAFESYARSAAAAADSADEATKRQIAQQIQLAGKVAGVNDQLIATAVAATGIADAAVDASARTSAAFDSGAQSVNRVAEAARDADTAIGKISDAADKAASSLDDVSASSREAASAARELDTVTTGYLGTVTELGFEVEKGLGANSRLAQAQKEEFDRLNPLIAAKGRQAQAEAAAAAAKERTTLTIEREIAQLERQNPQLQQENDLRAELERKYGGTSDELERLIQLRLEENKRREESLALGAQELAQAQQTVALNNTPAPKPSPASGGGVTINTLNVNVEGGGSPETAEYWNRITAQFIVPALRRIERLNQ